MEWIVPALGFLSALVGAWALWYRESRKTPLEKANDIVKQSGKAKEKIILDVQTKNTAELEKDMDRVLGDLRAIDGVRGKDNPPR